MKLIRKILGAVLAVAFVVVTATGCLNKRIEQRRNGKQSFLSFVRRSVNENALSVKGKIHCLRQPLTERQHTDR